MDASFIKPIAAEFETFERLYEQALKSENPTLTGMFDMLYASSGKKMRPSLVLLSAKAAGGISQASLYSAIAIELLHLASLVHDDVVDEAEQRRGKPSIKSKFDNKLAVLGGDCVLSSALNIAGRTDNMAVIKEITLLGNLLCEGEIEQYMNAKNKVFNEKAYFSVIGKKTASLFSACATIGCLTANNVDSEVFKILREFGRLAGLCFQIKDDIFDYSPKYQTGKDAGKDLHDGKATLPLIYIYQNGDSAVKKEVIQAFDDKNISLLQQMAEQMGGLAHAQSKMEELAEEAVRLLSILPDSQVRDALKEYIYSIINREK